MSILDYSERLRVVALVVISSRQDLYVDFQVSFQVAILKGGYLPLHGQPTSRGLNRHHSSHSGSSMPVHYYPVAVPYSMAV